MAARPCLHPQVAGASKAQIDDDQPEFKKYKFTWSFESAKMLQFFWSRLPLSGPTH